MTVKARIKKDDVESPLLSALLDTGAEGNFLLSTATKAIGVEVDLAPELRYRSLNGQLLRVEGTCRVPFAITDSNRGLRTRSSHFVVGQIIGYDIVLGMSWLEAWNPHLDFIKKTMIFRGSKAHCSYKRIKLESPEAFAHSMLTSMTDVYALYAGSVQDGQSETEGLPSYYAGKAVTFSKGDASVLPVRSQAEDSWKAGRNKVNSMKNYLLQKGRVLL
jgi:hypothetical protein